MTTQQPSEPSSHDAQCREFRRLLHIATLLRKQVLEQQELQQGVVIFGGSGAGKPMAAKVFLTTEDEKDK